MINLITVSCYICASLLVFLILGASLNLNGISGLFSKISRRHWVVLSFIVILALVLRLFIIPHRHYVFYDEYEHINIAKNMLENKHFARCNFYIDGKCLSADLPQWVPGYHFLLSMVFGFFGVSESAAYNFNATMAAISVAIMFFVTYLITEEVGASLISSLLLAFLPLHLKFSGNASQEMTSSLFLLLSIFAMLIFLKLRNSKSFFLLVCIVSFTLLVRPENSLILFFILLSLLMHRIRLKVVFKFSYFLFLLIPYFLYIFHIRKYAVNFWLNSQSEVSVLRLLTDNLYYWISNKSVPVIFVLGAIFGGRSLFKKDKITALWLIICFFGFLLFYTFLHKANISIGDFQRFNLQFYFTIIIFSSIGFYNIYLWISRYLRIKWIAFITLFIPIFINIFYCFGYTRTEISDPLLQKQHNLVLRSKEIDRRCIFVAYNPPFIITTLDRSSIGISYMFEDKIYDSLLKDKCLVLVNDYSCYSNLHGFFSALKDKYNIDKMSPQPSDDLDLFYLIKKKKF